jgi:anti-sigma factor RsiW
MTHLTEKIAEFVCGELSPSEMAQAQRHLGECSACREQVSGFQSTYVMLKSSPDAEPPRRILFEFEKPQRAAWIWRWVGPMTAAAAVAFAVVTLTPRPQLQPQVVERIVQQPVATAVPASAAAPQQVDYQQLIDELRADLKKRDAEHTKEFQRVRGEMALWEAYQLKIERDTDSNASQIQLLASNRVRN